MAILKKGTAYTRLFYMVSTVDHIGGLTGATPSVALSKAGAGFAAAAGAVTEVSSGNGWYKIALTSADTATSGDIAYHITATGGDPTDFVDQIKAQLFTDLVLSSSGEVTVGTNHDKTGYSLSQTFPSNFSSLLISSSGEITAKTLSGGAITTGSLASAVYTQVADTFLDRDMSAGIDSNSSSVRTPRSAFRFLRNKWAVSTAGTLTVYKEDDLTASWTAAVSTDATASPITGNDPA